MWIRFWMPWILEEILEKGNVIHKLGLPEYVCKKAPFQLQFVTKRTQRFFYANNMI
eukprot:UN06888